MKTEVLESGLYVVTEEPPAPPVAPIGDSGVLTCGTCGKLSPPGQATGGWRDDLLHPYDPKAKWSRSGMACRHGTIITCPDCFPKCKVCGNEEEWC